MKSKYNSSRAICNQGHTHASIKEANRCSELNLMAKAGVITNLKQQPEFILQMAFKYQGKTIREIKYRADFSYRYKKGKFVIEEVKGFKTGIYNLKKKMLLNKIKDSNIEFIET
jgi:hypothetical protein